MRECQYCRFWEGERDSIAGECRVNPPRLMQKPHSVDPRDESWYGFWPATKRDEWCGGFKSAAETTSLFPWDQLNGRTKYALMRTLLGANKKYMASGIGWADTVTFQDVLEAGRARFKAHRNVGPKTLAELDAMLSKHGLRDLWGKPND